ncbi:asparaginase [Novispirillum sp. DQ9]|uniref:asparaginase n=1 Tax=Novispirillum sp. DQ9 TaxID=3398612 RepID=UPI003C7B10CE
MSQAVRQPMADRPRVVLLSLGGVVSVSGPGRQTLRPTADGAALLAPLHGARGGADAAIVLQRTLRQVPSTFLTFEDLAELADEVDRHIREGAQGVVVAAGSDTLEELAFALDLLIEAEVPVVVTAALRPGSHPASDAAANLVAAVQVAADPAVRDLGVLVVLDEAIHAARFLRRAWSTAGGAPSTAFVSAPGGPLGWVAEGRPQVVLRLDRVPALPRAWAEPSAKVAVLESGLDVDGTLVDAAVQSGCAGIVVQAMGGGHVGPDMADALAGAAARIPVVVAPRALGGPTLRASYGFVGGEVDLRRRGVIAAGWLSGVQARVALTLLLRGGEDRRSITAWFGQFGAD